MRAGRAQQAGVSGVARRGARSAANARGRRQAAGTGRAGRADEQARAAGVGARSAGRGRAGRWAWARGARGLGVAWCAGWASRGLMQPVLFLTWVFDSGVFLSHRMDSVHEHCSSRIFSKKKKYFFKFN